MKETRKQSKLETSSCQHFHNILCRMWGMNTSVKKLIVLSLCIGVSSFIVTSAAFAQTAPRYTKNSLYALAIDPLPTEPTPTATVDPTPTVSPTPTPADNGGISISSDDPAYPLAQMVEGITSSTNLLTDGTAEITLSIPNKTLGGISILTSKLQNQLLGKIANSGNNFLEMNGYTYNSDENQDENSDEDYNNCEDSSNENSDSVIDPTITPDPAATVAACINSVNIVTASADKVDIKITGVIPSEISSQFIKAVVDEAGKAIVKQASSVIKTSNKKLNNDIRKLKNSLKTARRRHQNNLVSGLNTKINQLTLSLNQMEDLQYSVDTYKADFLAGFNSGNNYGHENNKDKNDSHHGNNERNSEEHSSGHNEEND